MDWRIADPGHLLSAVRVSLAQGANFLTNRIAPNGPILKGRSVSLIHKTVWGMYAAGVDHDTIARLLDWVEREAFRDNGDFYFPDEPPGYKDLQRVYRPLTFGKVAAWIDHPLIRRPKVLDRILQYQHKQSGGVFHFIGDDPDRPEEPPTIGSLNTTFFGHLMIALDRREEALAAGDWLRQWIDANRQPMAKGQLFTLMTTAGELVTDIEPGQHIAKIVDRYHPKQEFWHVGTAMAYLAVLYDTMKRRWNCTEKEARPYFEDALALLDFESTMPLDTYLWPSKCKVGWGAGELLRVLIEHDQGGPELIEKVYHVVERTAIFTFMDNQLPSGGWSHMHYPFSDSIPEMAYSYKPLKGIVYAPPHPIEHSETVFLSSEEITGEFLGEMKSIEQGLAAWLKKTTH
ncbi:MAG: hypothetical protein ACTSX7_04495 [Alphaproteobacteria bacterium]